MILYISVKLFRVGSQKFTRLLILPICAKKTKAKHCQIELHFAYVMALSDAVTALWECHVSEHCYGTMLCVCVKQSLRLLSSQFPPCLPAQTQPRFGFGACRGQPHLTSAVTQRLLWPLCYLMVLECTQSSLAGCCHYCDSHCSFHLGNVWFRWWFEVKEARPGFWGWHCKCSGKWTVPHLPSAGFLA